MGDNPERPRDVPDAHRGTAVVRPSQAAGLGDIADAHRNGRVGGPSTADGGVLGRFPRGERPCRSPVSRRSRGLKPLLVGCGQGGRHVQRGGGEHRDGGVGLGDEQLDLGAAQDDALGASLDQAADDLPVSLP